MKVDCVNSQAVAKRMFWLAWQACGGPLGMGVLQDNPGADEAAVWTNVQDRGDYPMKLGDKPGHAYGDYVFGRMMKLGVDYGDGFVGLPESKPHPEYQAWCRKYSDYKSLFDAAVASL